MSVLAEIGVAVLVALIAVVLLIATRPAEFRVERSVQIDAPRDRVHSLVNDLRQWCRWSPYEKYDANMKKTFEGPSSGPGAVYAWNGNGHVGEGRMTIVDSRPGERVAIKLEFYRPFKGTNDVNFTFVPSRGGTRASWIMDGKYVFVTKAMSLFMSMDNMMGKDFAEGLNNLKTIAEAASVDAREAETAPAATA